ncbi:MAG: nucleoside recognition domain-containing protein, partial [Planctomycetia bacterium]|nr:nucleoside recognition domain-containing protein [Planctomycetia bacterium]
TEAESQKLERALEYSCAGRLGKLLEPVMEPMGMDWKIGTAFIGAFAAKEIFVAQMGIVYSAGNVEEDDAPLREIMSRTYSPLTGLCILIFSLIASPCMATFAVMARESGSWKWAVAQWFGLTALAWVLCVTIFQIGTMCGF